MALTFLSSVAAQHIYPTAFRGSATIENRNYLVDPEAQLSTEENITLDVNSLVRGRAFVVDTVTEGNEIFIRCFIQGYFFKLNQSAIVASGANDYYVYIALKNRATTEIFDSTTNTGYRYYSLVKLSDVDGELAVISDQTANLDDESTFYGLVISDTEILSTNLNGADIYGLHILTKNSDTGEYEVPEASTYMFNINCIYTDGEENVGEVLQAIRDLLDKGFNGTYGATEDTNIFLNCDYNNQVSKIDTIVPGVTTEKGVTIEAVDHTYSYKPSIIYGTAVPGNSNFKINNPYEGLIYVKYSS